SILALNFPVGALCGGRGQCGKCTIRILDINPNISEPSKKELKVLGTQKLMEGFRLACQTKIYGDLRVYMTDALMLKGSRILVDADLKSLGLKDKNNLQPAVISYLCKIAPADLNNPRNDLSGLFEELNERQNYLKINEKNALFYIDEILHTISQKLPYFMRNESGIITTYFRRFSLNDSWKIYDIDNEDKTKEIFGLAIDIGTTTIVGYLIYLITGEITAISAMLNPQVAIGEDIISRISYIVRNNAIEQAKGLIIDGINQILEDCCAKAGVDVSSVKDISIVGNTGMHHIFFGVPPEFLSVSPYVPVFKAPINLNSGRLGLKCNPTVNVYSPPIIAGYVGTDTIGCIISSKIYEFKKYSLLIDIGTNGELVLGNSEGLVTGSCAAGSALEGAHISFGMRASEGAIESVRIKEGTLKPSIDVIGNILPLGICGSGLIDAIAEMLKRNIITRAGKFNTKSDHIIENRRIEKREDGYHYIIYRADWDNKKLKMDSNQKSNIREITISQKDINEIQLAKGAFLSAANLLIDTDDKKNRSIEQIILAGGFGTFINKENAAFIGLFPEVNKDCIFQIGNAAGIGAQLFITDIEQRNIANKIAHEVKYREIASSPSFQREYTFSLYFPHYNLDKFPSLREKYEEVPLT
ncbi:MAG: ASKHA domain-containing protein, partial [Promethearchaeota archaeon]